MTSTPLQLPLDLYSPEQLSAIIIELRAHSGSLRDTAIRTRVSPQHDQPTAAHTSALLMAAFREAGIKPTDQPGAEKLLKQLEAIRDRAPAVHLMMAALPNRDFKRKLVEWFRTEIHPYSLLTFATRADLGGGIIIQAGSHIYNYSFREQILSHKHRISEIYNSVR